MLRGEAKWEKEAVGGTRERPCLICRVRKPLWGGDFREHVVGDRWRHLGENESKKGDPQGRDGRCRW